MNTFPQRTTSPEPAAADPHDVPSGRENTATPPNLGRWVLVMSVLCIGGLLFGLVPRLRHRQALLSETRDLAVPRVRVVSAVPGKTATELTLPAEVRPFVEAPIYARASGFLKRWLVDIGARVEAGQLLADIDAPELDQELTGARAGLAQAEAALELARTTAARWAELLKTSSVSDQENAEKQADLALKVANVDAAKANVHRLEDLQSFTHVVAPFAGTITTRAIDVGDLISSGKELFRLADTRTLRVFVRVPQSATPSIVTNLAAEMVVPELPAHKFTAKVVRTAGAIDATSRTLLTELEVDNSRNEILAGSYTQVSFGELKQDPSLVLPSDTLLFRAEGPQVGVVGADGRVELRNVILGRDYGRTLEILSGIAASDRVIMNPSDSLVSGTVVEVVQLAEANKPQ
jgi:RND family efflux transporter MFP subunit